MSVQGAFLHDKADGRIAVKVDKDVFVGKPVAQDFKAPLKQPTDKNVAAFGL